MPVFCRQATPSHAGHPWFGKGAQNLKSIVFYQTPLGPPGVNWEATGSQSFADKQPLQCSVSFGGKLKHLNKELKLKLPLPVFRRQAAPLHASHAWHFGSSQKISNSPFGICHLPFAGWVILNWLASLFIKEISKQFQKRGLCMIL